MPDRGRPAASPCAYFPGTHKLFSARRFASYRKLSSSTTAGACSASWGTSSARSAARPAAEPRLAQPLQQTGATPRQSVSAHAVRTLCDGVRRQVRTRRSLNSRNSAAFRPSAANLSATGATVRFAPRRRQNSSNSAALRPKVRRVAANCEPRICGLSLAKYRAAPPRNSIRKTRTHVILTKSSIKVPSLT
jgi:hypothetical protein